MVSESYSAMYLAHILKINNMIKDTSTQLSSGLTQIIIITYFAVFIKIKKHYRDKYPILIHSGYLPLKSAINVSIIP